MKNATWALCTLFLLSTSFALSQSTPATDTQTTGGTASSAMGTASSTMSSMAGDPTAEASLQKMEMELSQASVKKDTAPFTKYLDENVIALGPGWHANGKASVLAGIKSTPCTGSNSTLSGFSYKWLTPEMVLVSYTENATTTCQGKSSPTVEHDTSLWQKKNGAWTNVFHQATADMPTPTAGA